MRFYNCSGNQGSTHRSARVGAIFFDFYWSWCGAVLRFQNFSVLGPTGSARTVIGNPAGRHNLALLTLKLQFEPGNIAVNLEKVFYVLKNRWFQVDSDVSKLISVSKLIIVYGNYFNYHQYYDCSSYLFSFWSHINMIIQNHFLFKIRSPHCTIMNCCGNNSYKNKYFGWTHFS